MECPQPRARLARRSAARCCSLCSTRTALRCVGPYGLGRLLEQRSAHMISYGNMPPYADPVRRNCFASHLQRGLLRAVADRGGHRDRHVRLRGRERPGQHHDVLLCEGDGSPRSWSRCAAGGARSLGKGARGSGSCAPAHIDCPRAQVDALSKVTPGGTLEKPQESSELTGLMGSAQGAPVQAEAGRGRLGDAAQCSANHKPRYEVRLTSVNLACRKPRYLSR